MSSPSSAVSFGCSEGIPSRVQLNIDVLIRIDESNALGYNTAFRNVSLNHDKCIENLLKCDLLFSQIGASIVIACCILSTLGESYQAPGSASVTPFSAPRSAATKGNTQVKGIRSSRTLGAKMSPSNQSLIAVIGSRARRKGARARAGQIRDHRI